jgi:hypothetical protein
LERQQDGHISVQTLIDIAEHLDIAVIIRFVDFPTFLRYTEDYSQAAVAPSRYRQDAIDAIAAEGERCAQESALRALFSPMPEQSRGQSVYDAPRLPESIEVYLGKKSDLKSVHDALQPPEVIRRSNVNVGSIAIPANDAGRFSAQRASYSRQSQAMP